jgi:hypothetical protein
VPLRVFWEEIIERSIKTNKNSTMEGQGQHSTIGSGAGKESTTEPKEVMMIKETWMQPYLAYMINKTLPEDTVEAKKDNTTIQGFCRVTREAVQEKYNMSFTMLRHSPGRTRNTKGYPRRSMRA